MNRKHLRKIFIYLLFSCFSLCAVFVSAQTTSPAIGGDIGTINSAPVKTNNRIAPGEFLPISVKLVNFGSQKRVDVIVNYQILDANQKEIYAESETVAVDTTASFVKHIQLPYNMAGGSYTAVSSLNYPYQIDPAVSKFTFYVEQKLFGIYRSDLLLYLGIAIGIASVISVLFYFFNRFMRRRSIVAHDYSNKPKEQIIYYEILSDILSQMRLRIGDDALEIAKNIPDLQINEKNGLIEDIKKDPAKIIALLIFRYEKLSGRRLSFGLR